MARDSAPVVDDEASLSLVQGSGEDSYEEGELVLGRMGWKERGQEEVKADLAAELEELENSTIEKLVIWSEKTDEASTLTSILCRIEDQLFAMEAWLDEHGKPLEDMQRDMSAIEGKNNALEIEWQNYQRLYEFLEKSISSLNLSQGHHAILMNLEGHFSSSALSVDDGNDDESAAEKELLQAIEAIDALEEALACSKRSESGSGLGLQFMEDSKESLEVMRTTVCRDLSQFLKRLMGDVARRVMYATMMEAEEGGLSVDSSKQAILHAQRRFHGYIVDYEPLFERLRKLGAPEEVQADLRRFYVQTVGSGLLASFIDEYCSELIPRIHFGKSNLNLSALPRVGIESAPTQLSSSSRLSDSSTISLAAAVDALLSQTTPSISREYAFFPTLFGLDAERSQAEKSLIHAELTEGFSSLRSSLNRIAGEVSDISDTISALTAIDASERIKSDGNDVALHILLEFKGLLVQKFFKFTESQRLWISSHRPDAKRAGILLPFARFPALVDAFQDAIRKVDPQEEKVPGEVLTAYQKLAHTLFQTVDSCAQSNPKYANVVRLENFYFFWKTVEIRKVPVLEDFALQARSVYEVCSGEYLEWLLQYQFPQLIEFFNRIEDLVVSVGAKDVVYHENKKKLEGVLKKFLGESIVMDGLRGTYARMQKHICAESGLLEPLYENLAAMLYTMASRFEELCMVCYGHNMQPSASDVRNMASWVSQEVSGGKGIAASLLAASSVESPTSQVSGVSVGSITFGGGSQGEEALSPRDSLRENMRRTVSQLGRGHSPRSSSHRNSIAGSLTASFKRHIRKSSSGL